jgi:hypothetical protein
MWVFYPSTQRHYRRLIYYLYIIMLHVSVVRPSSFVFIGSIVIQLIAFEGKYALYILLVGTSEGCGVMLEGMLMKWGEVWTGFRTR